MKKVLLALSIGLISMSANAQDDAAFSQGSSSVSVGYGFISPYKTLFKLSNSFFGDPNISTKFKSMGPVGLTYEYGFSEKISGGIQIGYSKLENTQTEKDGISAGKDYIIKQELTQLSVIARGNYHLGSSDKFDPYVGLGLGYGNFKYKVSDNDTDPSDVLPTISVPGAFGITGQLGAKYYFSSNFGLYAEVGYLAGSFVQAGLTVKF